METIYENLINGNLSDAKEKAKKYSCAKLPSALRQIDGSKGIYAAMFLKGKISWEGYCYFTQPQNA